MSVEAEQTLMREEKRGKKRPHRTSGVLWGLFMVATGAVFLYQRLTGADMPRVWDLWPLVFVVIGMNQLLDRRPGSAATWFVFAFVFMAVNFDWLGMTYVNSWPLFLIAIGLGMVIKSITGEERGRKC